MKKRTVTKLLSCTLAFCMAVTAAPVTAWASEVPAAAEAEAEDSGEDSANEDDKAVKQENPEEVKQEDTNTAEPEEPVLSEDVNQPGDLEGTEAPEEPAEPVPPEEAKSLGRSVPTDAVSDAWAQDPQTVIGTDSMIDIGKFLQLKSGSGNGNSESNESQYPAVFVNPNTFDFTKPGFFEFDVWPMSNASATRFGVYLDYKSPGYGMFFGFDDGGWFWQKYGSDNSWYSGQRVAKPENGSWTKAVIDWTGDGKFSLSVGGVKVFQDVASGLQHGTEGKIGFKCSTYSNVQTHVYLSSIYYTGQAGVQGNYIRGKVVDQKGTPVSGVKLSSGRQTAETAEDGTYALEVLDGNHNVSVTKEGYVSESVAISVDGGDVTADDIVLYSATEFETMELNTDDMKVLVAKEFPSIVKYEMKKGSLAGKTFFGQENRLMNIKINGTSIKVHKDDIEAAFTDTTATYEMTLKAQNIDCVITAVITAKDNTASFDITKVENNLKDLDENGYQLYPVQTIEIPNHSLISVNSSQENAHLKGAKMSSNTRISGDRDFDVTKGMKLTNNAASEDFMYGFISNKEMSAGLWSNSENEGSHVASNLNRGAARNTRVLATVTDTQDVTTLGLGSTQWYYDRKVETDVVIDRDENDQSKRQKRTYVVEHEIMPSAKVVIAGDENGDGDIDWQDGAVAFRSIMHNPFKSEEVPELVNYRIAMNFGSQAANPFLMNLDGVKRVYLNTEGLGQGVLLKGYGSEGHDSGHPDYGDIGRRIGGAADMNTLLTEGKKMGALFGVHVNASEMYAEAKAFSNELSQGNFGWNWLDQGIGINSRYDLATGARKSRFQELYEQVGNNLDFIYVDVWGNETSGGENEDSWASRMLAREITDLGWRFTTEWGATQEYDSTLQHWAADLFYGGYNAKGENSEVMRFLRNHQKDSWVADYPSYGGAAQAPLLGGLNMIDFEGWQGRTNYKNYITVMFRHNVITKFLQHYQVVDWVDGDPVQLPTGTWTPDMQITLRNTKDKTDDTELVVRRKTNEFNSADPTDYRTRTIEMNGVKISEGATTGGDIDYVNNGFIGNEKYLIPWNWDFNGEDLEPEDQKMYHWNTKGGTSTWTLTKDWEGLSNVVVYKLTDAGKTDKKVVSVVNNTITLEDIEAEIPYVIYKGEKEQLSVNWQSSEYVYDTGFNDQKVDSHRTVSGWGTAAIVKNASSNNMLKLEDEVSVSTQLTNLEIGQNYAVYVGVDNRSEAKAHMTVTASDGKVLGANYTQKSYAYNYVKSDQHNIYSHTGNNGDYSFFQNMFVFFTAEGDTATLTLKREEGEEATYFDDIRVVKTDMDVVKGVDEDGIVTSLYNDFEENAQGIWPFVIGSAEAVEDNRIHLSQRHDKFTQAGYINKKVDDVLDGDWSVKVNGLTQRNRMVYQTLPQNFHFQPGEEYTVSFDYQMGSEGTYEVRLGNGFNQNAGTWDLKKAAGEAKHFECTFTANENGQDWIGIFSTTTPAETGGYDLSDPTGYQQTLHDFAAYKDFILDNLRIEKTKMKLNKEYVEVTSAEEKIALNVEFSADVNPNTKVTWTSSDETVARVNGDGEVYFVGFGRAVITATAHFNDGVVSREGSRDISVSCEVYFPDRVDKEVNTDGVWANTEQGGSEGKENVVDGSAGTIWHSNWSNKFEVAEGNPAIITVKYQDDISDIKFRSFQQRASNVNGLVKKYECVVGDVFDEATHTVTKADGTDGFTTGVKTTTSAANGQIETLELPEDVEGHYLQIRVLEGQGGFAAIAEIWMRAEIVYDTEEERNFIAANIEELERQEEQIPSAQDELKAAIEEAKVVYDGGESTYSTETWQAFAIAYEAAVANQDITGLQKLAQLKKELVDAQAELRQLTEEEKEIDTCQFALKKAVSVAQAVIEAGKGSFTEASWRAFEEAYDRAKSGVTSTSVSTLTRLKTELETAQSNLQETAVSDLENQIKAAQKTLEKAIKEAKALIDAGRGNFTVTSWSLFEEAYDAARLGQGSTSVTRLNRLKADLEAAQEGLAEITDPGVDTSVTEAQNALKAVIDEATAKITAGKGNYTTASWSAFEEAYDAAKAGMTSTSVTKLNRLKKDLEDADKGLVENADPDTSVTEAQNALKAEIDKATAKITAGKGNYTTASWSAFEEAYDAAKAGMTSTSVTKLNRLKKDLEDADKGLVENTGSDTSVKEAQDALKTAISAADALIQAGKKDYTDASWSAFEEAYDAAKAGMTSTSVTKLNRLKKELDDAQKALSKISDPGTDTEVTNAQNALKSAIDKAKKVIDAGRNKYTVETWTVFEAAYDAAKAGVTSTSVSTLTRLKTELETAQAGLREGSGSGSDTQVTDAQNALKSAVEAAKKILDEGKKNYTDVSWRAFEEAYDAANAGVVSGSVSTLRRLKTDLEAAQAGLQVSEDQNEMEQKLEEARKGLKAALDAVQPVYDAGKKNYTNASWEKFEATYTRAASAYKSSASISKMERLAASLVNTQKALEENPKAGDTFDVKGVSYKVTSVSGRTVTALKGTDKKAASISIASTVKFRGTTFKVTAVSAKAFKGYASLKKVTIGSYVKTIKAEAFAGCKKLEQVSIGKKVSSIEKKAFYGCSKLKKVVFLGTGVKKIGGKAFKGTAAKMKVTLPAGTSSKKCSSIKTLMKKAGMSAKASVK